LGEQHVREDLGFIPSFADWVKAIRPEPWMGRTMKLESEGFRPPEGLLKNGYRQLQGEAAAEYP
jgi:hypothetical protein